MSTAIEMIGSTIFFGVLVLLVIELNVFALETSTQTTLAVSTQEQIIGHEGGSGAGRTLEHDLLKIGYRCSVSPAITLADSDRIQFRCDLDNDGTLDSVKYYMIGAITVPRDGNTRLKGIVRRVNLEPVKGNWLAVSLFRLSYFDGRGKIIPVPVSSGLLPSIRSIRVQLTVESTTRLQNTWDPNFAGMYWETTVSPANVQ